MSSLNKQVLFNTPTRGSQVLTGASKPLHADRLRVRLPISEPSSPRPTSISASFHAQQEFIDQLNARNTPLGKLKLNPLKVIVPYRKKLATLESQRIICVLDELKLKCEVILALPNVMKDLSKYKQLLGPNLTVVIQQHSVLLEEFYAMEKLYLEAGSPNTKKTLASGSTNVIREVESKKIVHCDISAATVRSRDTALDFLNTNLPATSSNKEKIKGNNTIAPIMPSRSRSRSASDSYSSYLTTLSDYTNAEQEMIIFRLNKSKADVEFSIRNVLRAFRNNEKIMQELLIETGGRRYKEGTYFLQCLSELRDMLMDRLLVTPLEQNEKMQFLAQIAAQERNNKLVIEKLEDELSQAIQGRDKEIIQRNDTIKNLQMKLEILEKATEDDIRRAKTESEKQANADKRASQVKTQKLSGDLKNLSSQLSVSTGDHRDDEQQLRKKKWKVESEIENWIHKYDEEMLQKQAEYEKIDVVYQKEKKQLVELEERFKVIEDEYKGIMKLRQNSKDKQLKNMQFLQKQVCAVVAIQALWRAFRVRKMVKAKEKEKRKGKKKGKQKKKAK